MGGRSPVFNSMFNLEMKEGLQNQMVIDDFSYDTVEAAIKFCYFEQLEGIYTTDALLSLLQFFDKYDIQQLKVCTFFPQRY